MASRIEVGFKKGIKDASGDSTKKRIVEDLHINVENVRTLEVYTCLLYTSDAADE